MPWMLLNGSREHIRAIHAGDDGRARRHAPARRRETWLLLGDLDCALYQAGVIDVVIERIARPHVIFAGGASVLDAVLALDGRALAFRIGWERMRAAHVLGAAALERAPLARLRRGRMHRNGNSSDAAPVPFDSVRPTPDGRTPALRLLRDGVFTEAQTGSQASGGELVAASLREKPAAKDLAVAIDASVGVGAGRVLLFGVDEAVLESQEVVRASNDARAGAVDVHALTLANGARPGTLGYMLPGLGRTDRLIESGRQAARRWLVEESDPAVV